MSSYTLRLPEDDSIVLSGQTVRQLIAGGSGDAALLYLALLKNKGTTTDESLMNELKWSAQQLQRAVSSLSAQGLISLPEQVPPPPPLEPVQRADNQRPEYTRADMLRALEGKEFASLTSAVEQKLGKKLTTPDLDMLLGLYDHVGLPSDVIFLLVNFCAERTARRYGPGRQPTMRQIEKEGYVWYRLGLMNQESAAAYIKDCHRKSEALPRMMSLLGMGDRRPSSAEEKYLTDWISMEFEEKAIEEAYNRTTLKCNKLEWRYMNKILCSWHEKGLHTLEQIEAGDKPGRQAAHGKPPATDTVKEDIARMERFRQQLRREKEGS